VVGYKSPKDGDISCWLAATHRHDYFQFVAICQLLRGEHAARHDLAIAFQCNALAGQAHFFQKDGHTGRIGKLASRAVNADGNHFLFGARLDRMRYEFDGRASVIAGGRKDRCYTVEPYPQQVQFYYSLHNLDKYCDEQARIKTGTAIPNRR